MEKQKGLIEILIVLIIILAGFVIAGGFLKFKKTTSSLTPVNIGTTVSNTSQKTLQLNTLATTSPTQVPIPLSTNACNHDNGLAAGTDCTCNAFLIECKNKKCERVFSVGFLIGNLPQPNPDPAKSCDYDNVGLWGNLHPTFDQWCSMDTFTRGRDGIFCIGKPVIYLYPQKDTLVNVKLNIPGEIVDSIPLYPAEGWQNILAHPNGSFEYLGKTYNELYFESAVNRVNPPKNGLVVEKKQLETELKTLTFKLGLIAKEQVEFIDYWMPKLNKLNYPYFFISVLESKEKERVDNVAISPTPDTKIEFLVYFKGLNKKITVDPPVLSNNPPQRLGFTTVEWGGTIEQ